MTDTPTPPQTATDAPEGASQPREGAGRPPGPSQTLSGPVEDSGEDRASRTPDEMAVARAIGDFAEHQAGIPPRLKALAVNAVGPALQARGEWLRLTTRQAVAVAVLVAVKDELEAATNGLPDVAGQCPACLQSGLFLGDGGYVTCAQIDCPDPTAADHLLHGEPQAAIEAKAADCAEAATISRVAERRTTYRARAAGLREALQILGRTTPDNSATSNDAADNPVIDQPDKPRHPDGREYSYAEIVAGSWGFCAGCRMWSNGTVQRPHQCPATHVHGPVANDGPSVAEAAADDRNWDVEQDGE